MVGIPQPSQRIDTYTFELSGGMRQRAMIAMALAKKPALLIADEPTTAIDVTIQAQIMELLHDLRDRLGMAILIITHDLGVVATLADRVAVMYLGRVVEFGTVRQIFATPKHPYTRGLVASIPTLSGWEQERLFAIRGTVPTPRDEVPGCVFHPRCSEFMAGTCDARIPPTYRLPDKRTVECLLFDGEDGISV